ncbi:MAG: CotH kinase family protein [Firmicutes bacterium]|nr:CotH kinase family protein [Bacillota bacterium]
MKKNICKILAVAIVMMTFASFATACNGNTLTNPPQVSISVTPSTIRLYEEESADITATVTVVGDLDTAAEFSSSDTAVAMVVVGANRATATVIGRSVGTATITVSAVADSSVTTTATVTVVPIPPPPAPVYVHFNTLATGKTVPSLRVPPNSRVMSADLPILADNILYEHRGYAFRGWNIGTRPFPAMGQVMTEDITLTAVWTRGTIFAFDTGDYAEDINPVVQVHGAGGTIDLPIPYREDYLFLRWELEVAGGQVFNMQPISTDAPFRTILLHARWIYNARSGLPALHIDLVNNQGETFPIQNVQNPNFTLTPWVNPWVGGSIRISNAGGYNLPSTPIRFRGRGSGSWQTEAQGQPPKRGYRIRIDGWAPVLGMPNGRDWNLVSGTNFDDRSILNNHLAQSMSYNIFTNIPYTARQRMVDVFVNGLFLGVYMIIEHPRIAPDRVPLETHLDRQVAQGVPRDEFYACPNSGWLVEYCVRASGFRQGAGNDWSPLEHSFFYARYNIPTSGLVMGSHQPYNNMARHPWEVISPDPENAGTDRGASDRIPVDVFQEQTDLINIHVSSVMHAIFTGNRTMFMQYADLASWVDMYILHELFKNTDTGWSSIFFMRTPYNPPHTTGLMYAVIPWDFDASLGRNRPYAGQGHHQTSYGFYVACSYRADYAPPTFSQKFYALTRTNWFMTAVRLRWAEISGQVTDFVRETLSEEFVESVRFNFGRDLHFYNNFPNRSGGYTSQEIAERLWMQNHVGVYYRDGVNIAPAGRRIWLESRIKWLTTNNWQMS